MRSHFAGGGQCAEYIEQDPRRCEFLAEQLTDSVVINADGTDQQILLRESVEGADAFVALTGNYDANLIVCLLARRLGVNKVVPQLNRLNYLPLAQRLGINTSVSRRTPGVLYPARTPDGSLLAVLTISTARRLRCPDRRCRENGVTGRIRTSRGQRGSVKIEDRRGLEFPLRHDQ